MQNWEARLIKTSRHAVQGSFYLFKILLPNRAVIVKKCAFLPKRKVYSTIGFFFYFSAIGEIISSNFQTLSMA